MRQRGKKSASSIELNVIEGDFGGKRPDPPDDLSARQAEIWKQVVLDEPLDYFSTAATRSMLKDYCIHRQTAEGLTETINAFPIAGLKSDKGLRHYQRLLKTRDAEIRAAASLATKLRLTNQARYTALSAATASRNTLKGIKPWDWEK